MNLGALVLAASLVAGGTPAAPDAEIVRRLNAVRAVHGAPPLRVDPRLARAARRHSRDMVVHRYFAHASRSGARFSVRITRTGWMRGRGRWWVGETLAWGVRSWARPGAVVRAWLASPSHRRVMLRPQFHHVGVGVVRGTPSGDDGLTYTADYGS